MQKKKSTIFEAVRDTAKGLHKAGLMDRDTLHEFDRMCWPLIEPPESAKLSDANPARKPRL